VGAKAPEFALLDANGREVTLSSYAGRTIVVVFYPLDWSPGCSKQLDLYQQEWSEFEKRDVEIVGISVDSLYSHGAWAAARGLSMPLLADFNPKGEVARRYNVWRDADGFPSARSTSSMERASSATPTSRRSSSMSPTSMSSSPSSTRLLERQRMRDANNGVRVSSTRPSSRSDRHLRKPLVRHHHDDRRYLDRAGIPYRFVDWEAHPEVRSELEWLAGGRLASPTIKLGGQVLVQPSMRELEWALARAGYR
jgi:peroxiredoxin/glutaredoxin